MNKLIMHQITLLFLIVIGLSACSNNKPQDVPPADIMKELHQEIQTIIPDQARAEQVISLADELNQIFNAASIQNKKDKERYHSLNTDFSTTEEEFKTFLNDLNNRVRKRQSDVLDIRNKIKSQLTSEEWTQFNDIRAEFIHANAQWM